VAKWTGTQILAMARLHAQDNDTNSNFAVGAADALLLLNNILVDWAAHQGAKANYVGASSTGLTFSSGDVSKETDGTPNFLEIVSAHPANSATLAFPVSPELRRVSVPEILDLLRFDGDTALTGQESEWECFAAERTEDSGSASLGTEKWRVWGFPVINRTRHMTLKVIPATEIAAITDTPDLDEGDARIIARLLAWEIARLKKESTPAFMESIIAPLPKSVLDRVYRGGVNSLQLPAAVEWREW